MTFNEGDLVEYRSPDVSRFVRTVKVVSIGTDENGERVLQVAWPEGGRWCGGVFERDCKEITQ